MECSNPSEKWSSSVGIMKFPIYGKIKAMFQTTNQYSWLWKHDVSGALFDVILNI